jgi:hypothetical protein
MAMRLSCFLFNPNQSTKNKKNKKYPLCFFYFSFFFLLVFSASFLVSQIKTKVEKQGRGESVFGMACNCTMKLSDGATSDVNMCTIVGLWCDRCWWASLMVMND